MDWFFFKILLADCQNSRTSECLELQHGAFVQEGVVGRKVGSKAKSKKHATCPI